MVYITIGNSNTAYISDNIIRNNKANNSAGIRLQSGILYLENNEITNNSATSGSPGGVYCYNNSTLYYKNNKIYNILYIIAFIYNIMCFISFICFIILSIYADITTF